MDGTVAAINNPKDIIDGGTIYNLHIIIRRAGSYNLREGCYRWGAIYNPQIIIHRGRDIIDERPIYNIAGIMDGTVAAINNPKDIIDREPSIIHTLLYVGRASII